MLGWYRNCQFETGEIWNLIRLETYEARVIIEMKPRITGGA